jgi:hypothetical protein
MDSLKDLPIDDKSQLSSEQRTVMEKYVGAPAVENTGGQQSSRWMIIAYLSALFVALINPMTQGLFDRFPYFGGNNISVLVLTTIIFMVATTVIVFYA